MFRRLLVLLPCVHAQGVNISGLSVAHEHNLPGEDCQMYMLLHAALLYRSCAEGQMQSARGVCVP